MDIDVLTLFPEFFEGPFGVSMLARAQKLGIVALRCVQVRDFAEGKHRRVDDRPFGGGPGMVMKPEPLVSAIRSCKREGSHVIYLSPQGSPLTAQRASELALLPHLILVCGHYEGIDERVVDVAIDEEISIGDYVLISGCAPAVVLIEAVTRFLPGFLGDEESAQQESFQNGGGFDCPHFTHPQVFEGYPVPDVLRSGNHQAIAKWREEQAYKKTRRVRPELVNHSYQG